MLTNYQGVFAYTTLMVEQK